MNVRCRDHGGRSDVSRCVHCADGAMEAAAEFHVAATDALARLTRAAELLDDLLPLLAGSGDAEHHTLIVLECVDRSRKAALALVAS